MINECSYQSILNCISLLSWNGSFVRYDYVYNEDELAEFTWRHPYFNQDKIVNGTDCTFEFDEGAVDKLPWLSGRHECEWAFVKCDRDRFVTSIEMRELFIFKVYI